MATDISTLPVIVISAGGAIASWVAVFYNVRARQEDSKASQVRFRHEYYVLMVNRPVRYALDQFERKWKQALSHGLRLIVNNGPNTSDELIRSLFSNLDKHFAVFIEEAVVGIANAWENEDLKDQLYSDGFNFQDQYTELLDRGLIPDCLDASSADELELELLRLLATYKSRVARALIKADPAASLLEKAS